MEVLEEERISGVYRITNKNNGKLYIGISNNIFSRMKDHLVSLKKGRHSNQRMQEEFDLHGEESFIFEIIDTRKFDLRIIEAEYIVKNKSILPEFGYNYELNMIVRKNKKLFEADLFEQGMKLKREINKRKDKEKKELKEKIKEKEEDLLKRIKMGISYGEFLDYCGIESSRVALNQYRNLKNESYGFHRENEEEIKIEMLKRKEKEIECLKLEIEKRKEDMMNVLSEIKIANLSIEQIIQIKEIHNRAKEEVENNNLKNILSEKLTTYEKIVCLALKSFNKKEIDVAIGDIMNLSSLSRSTVHRVLNSLEEKGYIVRKQRFDVVEDGKQLSNLYRLEF